MVQITTDDINKLVTETEKSLREGAYVAVGLGVLGFQRAQVRRREMAKLLGTDAGLAEQINGATEKIAEQLTGVSDRVATNLASSREQFGELFRTVDERVAPTRAQIDQQVDALQERLPASARNVLSSLRSALAAPEASPRNAVGLTADR